MNIFKEMFPMWKAKIDYVENGNIAKNIIIGDSRMQAAFNPKELKNRDYYNLSLGGGTPLESYYLLKKIIEKNKIEKIIISFSPFHLVHSDWFLNGTLKWDFFDSHNDLLEVLKISSLHNDLFFYENKESNKLIQFFNYVKAYNTYYNNPIAFLPELKNLIYNPNQYFINKDVYKKITSKRGHYFYGTDDSHSGITKEGKMLDFNPSPVLLSYFLKTLKIASENKIKVYYISTPFNKSTYEKIPEKFFKSYNDYFDKIKINYPNIYWQEKLYHYPDSCFGDPSHLNKKGSHQFTNQMLPIITK